MSDGTDTITASAAPPSSQDIAAAVVSDAEQADTSGSSDAPPSETGAVAERGDPTTSVEPASPTPTPTAAELSAAAKFLLQQGHQNKKLADGRDTRLPYGTVEKMLDRYLDQHRSTWTTEKTTLESRARELAAHLDTLRASVAGDPRAFLAELAGIDPRYQAFLAPTAEAARQAEDAAMPQPDLTLADGAKTYSLQGLQALLAWNTKRVEGTIEARLKPFAERDAQAKAREDQDRLTSDLRTRTHAQLQDAQSWPLFGKIAEDGSLTEFQQAVLEELQRDTAEATQAHRAPSLTLQGAYIRVAGQRFTEDDATKRARLLKEIQAAPKSSALSRQTTDAPRAARPRSSTEIAREVLSKLESGN